MNRIVSEGRNAEKTKKGCIETEPTPQRGTHQRRVWGSQRALTSGPEWDVLLVLTTLQSLGLEATVSSPFPSPEVGQSTDEQRPFTLLHRWALKSPISLHPFSLHPFLTLPSQSSPGPALYLWAQGLGYQKCWHYWQWDHPACLPLPHVL